MRGKLIVIEGIDGSGKQTQAQLLYDYLFRTDDRKVMKISFPQYEENFVGALIDKLRHSQATNFADYDPRAASVLYAADRWESKLTIEMALNTGINVVCDRYASANQVHQGGKISDEDRRREFMAWLDKLEFEIFGIPQPDVSIYLDVPPAVSEGNMSDKLRDEVEKNPDYIRNSYKSAQWLMRNYPEKWIHIKCADGDTMRTREEIHQEVLAALRLRHIL